MRRGNNLMRIAILWLGGSVVASGCRPDCRVRLTVVASGSAVNDQLPAAMPRPDAGLIDCAQCGMIGHHKKMIKSQRHGSGELKHAEWWDEEYEKLQAQLDAAEERIESGFQPEAFQDHQNQARTAFL